MLSSSGQESLQVPRWTFVLRVAQAMFALIALILTAYAASVFGAGTLSGYGLTWFTCILTFVFLLLGLFAGQVFTGARGKRIPHILLTLEVLTTIWWLIAFAVLAHGASHLSDLGTVVDEYCGGDDGCTTYEAIMNVYGPPGTHAIGASKAAAAFGGVEFILFLVTLVLYGLALRARRRGGAKSGTELDERHQGWYNQRA